MAVQGVNSAARGSRGVALVFVDETTESIAADDLAAVQIPLDAGLPGLPLRGTARIPARPPRAAEAHPSGATRSDRSLAGVPTS